jgi:hypothetical protein
MKVEIAEKNFHCQVDEIELVPRTEDPANNPLADWIPAVPARCCLFNQLVVVLINGRFDRPAGDLHG